MGKYHMQIFCAYIFNMDALYPFFIAFVIIFLAELGDKTQLLVLSFASKSKTHNILLGIAIGSFFSHGIAIILGSKVGNLQNEHILIALKFITYITFLILGVMGFIPKRGTSNEKESNFLKKVSKSSLNYIFLIAFVIMVGEIGDKTFLASMGLGLEYPNFKLALITGSILGMIVSNSIVIIFGKFIEGNIPAKYVQILSSIIFILFGLIGSFMLFF